MKKEPVAAGSNVLTVDEMGASTGNVAQASPYKSATEELDALRKTLRAVSQHYAKRIDMEIIRLRESVAEAGQLQTTTDSKKKRSGRDGTRDAEPGNSRLYDLRDMITLLRTLDVKPVAGRRKDLKKVESLVDELRMLVARWK